jgi:hypothetical protein
LLHLLSAVVGTSQTNGDDARTSAYRGQSGHRGGIAQRPTLTHLCHSTINFVVMHNAAFLHRMW